VKKIKSLKINSSLLCVFASLREMSFKEQFGFETHPLPAPRLPSSFHYGRTGRQAGPTPSLLNARMVNIGTGILKKKGSIAC